MNNFFDSVDLLHRTMDVQQLRLNVTANNIANSEVKGYKRQMVNFESELERAFKSRENEHDSFHLKASKEGHFTSEVPRDWRSVEPRRITDWQSTIKPNGNNVDVDYEANNFVQIQMQYKLLTQLTSFQFSQLETAMKKI